MAVTTTVTWTGEGNKFEGTVGSGHQVIVDAPVEPGAPTAGPRPKELVIVGLAGCSGTNLVSLMKKMRQPVTRIAIAVGAEVAEEDPQVFTQITMQYRLWGNDVDEKKVKKALDYIEEKYCGVLQMLNKTAKVTFTYEVHPESVRG